jgi:Cu2+-exporting ATPase
MKTSVIEIHDMLSVWNVDEAERRIGEVPGVESVTVRQRGYQSAASAAYSAGDVDEGHAAPGAPDAASATPTPPPTMSSPDAAVAAPAAEVTAQDRTNEATTTK